MSVMSSILTCHFNLKQLPGKKKKRKRIKKTKQSCKTITKEHTPGWDSEGCDEELGLLEVLCLVHSVKNGSSCNVVPIPPPCPTHTHPPTWAGVWRALRRRAWWSWRHKCRISSWQPMKRRTQAGNGTGRAGCLQRTPLSPSTKQGHRCPCSCEKLFIVAFHHWRQTIFVWG